MNLEIKNRTVFGKQTHRLRREGFIPAELYGHGSTNVHLAVSAKTFAGIYRDAGMHTIITIIAENGEKIPALIVAAERDPITRAFLAVDFHRVKSDETVKAKIPIEFTGEAPAVKAGHLVVTVLNELEVEAFPADLPHRFTVDIGTLANVGESIHVGDMKLPKGVKVHTSSDMAIVTVGERRKEEAVTQPSAPVAEETAAPAPDEGKKTAEGEKTKQSK
ncbi:MAG: 50S ribosomal protein L25 [Candidatus Jorgensenbacteria bacterium]